MKRILTILTAAVLAACSQPVKDDPLDLTDKFKGTFNIYEKFEKNADGSITYTSMPFGGLVGMMKEHNMPVDWTPYESISFEFAEPTTVETQILLSDRQKTWGRPGITSLTCFFDGQDVRNINEVALQTADSSTITVKRVRLSPKASNWEPVQIWEGDCHFGNWEKGFIVKPEKFQYAIEGDRLEFVFTTDTSDPERGNWLIKTIYDGTDMTLEGNYNELNKWGCATVGRNARSYRIALTANDIKNLKEKGMFVNGYYNNVTKCNLLRKVVGEQSQETGDTTF